MRVIVMALVVLVSTTAVAQPTTDKPPETAPTGTDNVVTLKVTSKRFGTVKTGKKLTAAVVKKLFPKATVKAVKGEKSSWMITRGDDLLVHANATKITVARGPIEVHGVMIGDDGRELSSGNFAGAHCAVDPEIDGVVICNKDAVSIELSSCAAKAEGDGVPLASLAGCKVFEIAWIAYAPRAP